MHQQSSSVVPHRSQTLDVLRLMAGSVPLLMLRGSDDGYGTRWVLDGQQVPPGIARYLADSGFVAEQGATEFGARRLLLTEDGKRFLENGIAWWSELGLLERLRVTLFG